MKRIIIHRKEMTTYSVVRDLPDSEANELLEFPESNIGKLANLCRANNENWVDSDEPQFDVEASVE